MRSRRRRLEEYHKMNWPRFVRVYLTYIIKLCRFNPAGGGYEGFGPSVRYANLPMWSHAGEVFYIYFALKLLVSQILQHQYNGLQFAIATSETNGTTTSMALQQQQQQAELLLERAIARLEAIGNAYFEFGYAVEPLFVYLLILIYLIYVQTHLYKVLWGPVSFGAIQMMLDPEREQCQVTGRQIACRVGEFVASSGHFVRAHYGGSLAAGNPHYNQELPVVALAQERGVRAAQELAREGQLVPPNRRREALPRLARTYGLLVAGCQCTCSLLVTGVLVVLPWSGLLVVRPRAHLWTQILFQVEILTHAIMGVQHITFYLANGFIAAYEQLHFVRELQRQATSLIADTCRQSMVVATCFSLVPRASLTRPRLRMDGNAPGHQSLSKRLLRFLILYKLLQGQMRLSQPPVGFIGAHVTLLMLVVPMLNRIYMPYLAPEIRWIMVVCALTLMATCDLLVLPSCMLHARCLDLFRSMSSLLAHIDAHQAAQGSRSVFDPHTVMLLRREQNEPHAALRRFATDATFLKLTYSSFLRTHFWCGLLLAPVFLRDNAQGRGAKTGNLLTDSLRLF